MPKKKEADKEAVDPADRKYFILTEEQWNTFWEMLESSIDKDYPKLRELMAKKPIWEEECPPSSTA